MELFAIDIQTWCSFTVLWNIFQ